METFSVQRNQGTYPSDELRYAFEKHGIVVLRDFISSNMQTELRSLLELKLAQAILKDTVLKFPIYPNADFLLGDVLSIRELEKFEYIFFRKELLDVIRTLLSSQELIYFGDSSVNFGESGRGFHKDNVDRSDGNKDDWNGNYGLVRCGFYFEDHVRQSGGLKVRMGSHNITNHKMGTMKDVRMQFGDIAIWNLRLTHSGNNRKMKFRNSVILHPRIEGIIPSFLTVLEEVRRIAAFCVFARPGPHFERYINNFKVREPDIEKYLRHSRNPQDTIRLLTNVGVNFRQPSSCYGDLDVC